MYLASAATFIILASPLNVSAAQNKEILSKENKLKAAYILNFTKYLDWPNNVQNESPRSIVICLQEMTPFDNFLRQLVANKSVDTSQGEIAVYLLEEDRHCDLIYLHRAYKSFPQKHNDSVVVMDSIKFANRNTAIAFYVEKRKLRFEINREAMKHRNVTVSSELLKLARIR